MSLLQLLSRQDAISLLELIHRCVCCTTENEFRTIEAKLLTIISYDYSLGMSAEVGSDGAVKSYEAINLGYPSEWIARYIAQQLHNTDPILLGNYKNFKLQYFEDLLNRYPFPKKEFGVANDFGIVDGYVHGIRNYSGTQGSMFCFAGRKIPRDRRMEAILELVTPHLHQAFNRILSLNKGILSNGHAPLSGKEKEVLKWLKYGKSTWDISVILGISERTVKFHISNIMKKLDASTRTHAVAIAIEQGLVEIE